MVRLRRLNGPNDFGFLPVSSVAKCIISLIVCLFHNDPARKTMRWDSLSSTLSREACFSGDRCSVTPADTPITPRIKQHSLPGVRHLAGTHTWRRRLDGRNRLQTRLSISTPRRIHSAHDSSLRHFRVLSGLTLHEPSQAIFPPCNARAFQSFPWFSPSTSFLLERPANVHFSTRQAVPKNCGPFGRFVKRYRDNVSLIARAQMLYINLQLLTLE